MKIIRALSSCNSRLQCWSQGRNGSLLWVTPLKSFQLFQLHFVYIKRLLRNEEVDVFWNAKLYQLKYYIFCCKHFTSFIIRSIEWAYCLTLSLPVGCKAIFLQCSVTSVHDWTTSAQIIEIKTLTCISFMLLLFFSWISAIKGDFWVLFWSWSNWPWNIDVTRQQKWFSYWISSVGNVR